MHDIEVAARRLVDAQPESPAPEPVITRGRALRRRRRWRNAAAVAVVVALVAGTVAATRPTHGGAPEKIHAVSGTPETNSLARQQLDAHLGLGLPQGWKPVDVADARLWVPPSAAIAICPDMTIGFTGAPACGDGSAITMQRLGRFTITTAPVRTVHGYALYAAGAFGSSTSYAVPALDVRIVVGTDVVDAKRVLGTLAPSARAVALRADAILPTTGWPAVRFGGLSIRVPPNWAIEDLAATRPDPCQLGEQPANTLLVGSGLASSCPLPDRTSGRMLFDGVWLGHGGGSREVVVDNGRITSSFVATPIDTHIGVRVAGTATPITIATGRDGRIAATVLHSIRTVRSNTFSVAGCPATQPSQAPTQPSYLTHIVEGHPTSAIVCRYYGSGVAHHGAKPGTLSAAHAGYAGQLQSALNASRPTTNRCVSAPTFTTFIRFGYANGSTHVVLADPHCGLVTDGTFNVAASASLLTLIGELDGHDCTFTPNSVVC